MVHGFIASSSALNKETTDHLTSTSMPSPYLVDLAPLWFHLISRPWFIIPGTIFAFYSMDKAPLRPEFMVYIRLRRRICREQ